MKLCLKCLIEKPFDSFHKKDKSKDGFQIYCKSCRKDIDRDSYLKSDKRKLAIQANNQKLRLYNRRLMNRYKSYCGCKICNENEPCALDFHHLDPSQKEFTPAILVSHPTRVLKSEIRKCIVLCANCHRKVHAGIIQLEE